MRRDSLFAVEPPRLRRYRRVLVNATVRVQDTRSVSAAQHFTHASLSRYVEHLASTLERGESRAPRNRSH